MDARDNLRREHNDGLDIVTFGPPRRETYYITARPSGDDPLAVFREVGGAVREREAKVVSQTVFGDRDRAASGLAAMEAAFGSIDWPVTWLDGGSGLMGTQVSALSGVAVEPVHHAGRVVGSEFQDGHARYCFLGNLMSTQVTRARPNQVRDTFELMEEILGKLGMSFEHVVRTWLYVDSILDWYGELNQARTQFFTDRNVFAHLMPASTGIGVSNTGGTALAAECIAMESSGGAAVVHEVESPLQCEASDYKSSFSRAAEVVTPDYRRLYISGTASIADDGTTVYQDDVESQIARTMEVVWAIIQSRGMDWPDVSRGVAYFRDVADVAIFDKYCSEHGVPRGVLLETPAVVCRDDLLFELEANAIAGAR
jgi:enamine deaminase RidA (YjgF/YER057c/UK114 family)